MNGMLTPCGWTPESAAESGSDKSECTQQQALHLVVHYFVFVGTGVLGAVRNLRNKPKDSSSKSCIPLSQLNFPAETTACRKFSATGPGYTMGRSKCSHHRAAGPGSTAGESHYLSLSLVDSNIDIQQGRRLQKGGQDQVASEPKLPVSNAELNQAKDSSIKTKVQISEKTSALPDI